MKLNIKGGGPKDKQTLMAIGAIVVIILVGGWFVYSNFFAGSGDSGAMTAAPVDAGAPPPGPGAPPAGPGMPPGATPPGAPTGATPPGAPPGAPPATPAPAAAPSAPAAPSPSPAAAPSAPAKAPVAPAGKPTVMKTVTVFATVTVSYPSEWGIDAGSSGSAAVLTDRKARFEIHAPDPKANNAKEIADSALRGLGKSAKVSAQGPLKVSNYDAYQYTLGSSRLIGVDSPTRILIIERVSGGQMAAYKPAFDKIESGLQFK